MSKGGPGDYGDLFDTPEPLTDEQRTHIRRVLDQEWTRVRENEPTLQLLKGRLEGVLQANLDRIKSDGFTLPLTFTPHEAVNVYMALNLVLTVLAVRKVGYET